MFRNSPFSKKKKQSSSAGKPRKRVPNLKKTLEKSLDRYFSLYIRLRDTDENGYFKCPTCGRVLPFEKADC